MIELLLPCGFDTLEYSWVKAIIGICTLAYYSMAKKHQHRPRKLLISKTFYGPFQLNTSLTLLGSTKIPLEIM
jgi:hypothetical protein